MVKIGLQIKAVLEFVTGIYPEGDDFRWYLKLRCANCGEVPDHWQYITLNEEQPLKGGRGHASCVLKCKLCSRENSIDIIRESVTSYNADDNNKPKVIVAFDCRGLEPADFSPRNGWTVKGYKENDDGDGAETGTVFNDVDLTEKEWADYDEKSGESPTVSEFTWEFVKMKH